MHIDLYECEPQLSKSQLVDITIVKSCMGPIHVFLIFDTPYLFALINLKFNSRYFFRIFTIMAWQHIFLGQYHILSFVDIIFNRSLTWIPLHLRVSIFLFFIFKKHLRVSIKEHVKCIQERIKDHLFLFLNILGGKKGRTIACGLWVCIIWVIWNWRNKVIF